MNIYAQTVPKVLVGTKSDLLQNEKKAEKDRKKKEKLTQIETDRTVKQKEIDSVMKDYSFHSFSTCSSINQVKLYR